MTLYRVSVLDAEGVVANSRVSSSLAHTAKLMLDLASCIGEPWTKPLLDADGELTVSVKGAGERELSDDEKTGLAALLEKFGASYIEETGDGGRWGIADTETNP